MKCMYDVWKKHGYAWLWLCMLDSWIEITAMSCSRMTIESYLATVAGDIALGTYHWGFIGVLTFGLVLPRFVGVLIDGSVLPRLKGSYRVVGHPNDRLKSHDWWLYHGHKKCTLRGNGLVYSVQRWIIRQCIVAYCIWHRMLWLLHDMISIHERFNDWDMYICMMINVLQ